MKPKKDISRRDFIKKTTISGLGFTIVPSHVLGGPYRVAPSDKLTIGIIGCGTQGIRSMMGLLRQEDVQIVSVCDPNKFSTDYVDWSHNERKDEIREILGSNWMEGTEGVFGGRDLAEEIVNTYYADNRSTNNFDGVSKYADFREQLEEESDMDAVQIVTPDHTHAAIAIEAMKKGKHVAMHKPLANRVYEARKVVDVARETGVTTRCLGWTGGDYDQVKNWIEDGAIGTLREIHRWSPLPMWPHWPTYPNEKPPVPEGMNWDLWLGPVPDHPYHPNFTHATYRGWYDFGGGVIADNGYYSLWPVFNSFDLGTPNRVEATGSYTGFINKNRVSSWRREKVSFPYSTRTRFDYPARGESGPVSLYWYDGGWRPQTPEELKMENKDMSWEGMMFVGDDGKILDGEIIPQKKMDDYRAESNVSEPEESEEEVRWIDAFKEGTQPHGNFLDAEDVAETICLSPVALQANTLQTRTIEWDSENFSITNIPEANEYLSREYRRGWEI